jgi:hypothetical protein
MLDAQDRAGQVLWEARKRAWEEIPYSRRDSGARVASMVLFDQRSRSTEFKLPSCAPLKRRFHNALEL